MIVKFDCRAGRDFKLPFKIFFIYPEDKLGTMIKIFPAIFGFRINDSSYKVGRLNLNNLYKSVLKTEDITEKVIEREGKNRNRSKDYYKLESLFKDLYREENPWHIGNPVLSLNKNIHENKKKYSAKGLIKKNKEKLAKNLDPRTLNGGQVTYHVNREDSRPAPKQLTVGAWSKNNWRYRQIKDVIPQNAYFATRKEVIKPICSGCPNLMNKLKGKCHIGSKTCYKMFREYLAPNMFKHLNDYDAFLESTEIPDNVH